MAITRKEQEFRRDKIGGSDAPTILGVNAFDNVPKLWMRITGRLPATEVKEPNPAMRFGTLVEPVVCDELARQLNVKLKECSTIIHPEHPFLVGHPDRLVVGKYDGKTTGVEIKTCGIFRKHLWEDKDGNFSIPSSAVIQASHYMMVADYDAWIVAVLVHGVGWDLRWGIIHRDPELEKMILESEVEFWDKYVVANQEPPLDTAKPEALDFLKARYPWSSQRVLVASSMKEQELLCHYKCSWKRLQVAQTELDKAKAEVQAYMTDASAFQWPDGHIQVTWKTTKPSKRVNWEGVTDELTAKMTEKKKTKLLDKHTETKPGYRVFRFTEQEEAAK